MDNLSKQEELDDMKQKLHDLYAALGLISRLIKELENEIENYKIKQEG